MKYFDRTTGFTIADPTINPVKGLTCTKEDVLKSLEGYILSASGWRAVFAESKEDEDDTKKVRIEDLVITEAATETFIEYLGVPRPRILIGVDARPTGQVLCDVAVRTLLSLGCEVTHLFFAAAPEIMAYSNAGFDGFFYISASHNPIGHNGFKFGVDGGVYNKSIIDKIIPMFLEKVNRDDIVSHAIKVISEADPDIYAEVLMKHDDDKIRAFDYYRQFVLRIATAHKLFRIPFGIVAEMNGSARSASIDIPYLNKMGAKVWAVNAQPRQVAHAIVPEGENLELCRKTLEEIHKKDSDYILGYVPDNDGDRGNFVYMKHSEGRADILNAQEVFALVALIDLAHQVMAGDKRPAIAVNGPTSNIIDEIASRLGAKVFRSDVGEANVVTLAEKLRSEEGYQVHICGEGSNGGNITHPAKVRDPMNSIMSIAKLYSIDGLYSFICSKFGIKDSEHVSIENVINALPRFTTTPAFSKDAVMRIKSTDFDALKLEYERIFLSEVDSYLKDGIAQYEVHQIEGIKEQIGLGPEFRNNPSSGGYKVIFTDSDGNFVAYIWLSKSKTEPVMRVMADVKGDNKALHDRLLSWQRSLVLRADDAVMAKKQ